ncbi:MAG: TatD family nuclease-associated radical SAM protein [Clostridiales bacterium]|jgi:TatD family-associated radical SAM protein|nr:TatD family nuclease-associated radical SAM protein [Clostridiales bacterium]
MNTYLYGYQDKLYINLTNLCSNNCDFCVRNTADGVGGHNLWLENEPSAEEIIAELRGMNLDKYAEFVFCGFGEPLYAFEKLIEIGRFLKGKGKKTRLNTNGQASLIIGREVLDRIEKKADKNPGSVKTRNENHTKDGVCTLQKNPENYAESGSAKDSEEKGICNPYENHTKDGVCNLRKNPETGGCRSYENPERKDICKRVVGILRGAVDTVGISLNASNAERYNEICRCAFGGEGFYAMLEFAKECAGKVKRVILSVVDTIGEDEIEKCKRLAGEVGAELRIRKYSAV